MTVDDGEGGSHQQMEGSRPRSGLRASAALYAFVALVALSNVLLFSTSRWIRDDAYIYFRYVENWLHGGGLTWNAGGPHVEGYTSLLWVLLLASARARGVPLVVAAQALALGCYVLTAVAAAHLVVRVSGRRSAGLLAGLLVGTSGLFAYIARNGMEPTLFCWLALSAIAVSLRPTRRVALWYASGLLFGLATLARPEGILLFAVWTAWSLRQPTGESGAAREALYRALGLATVVVPHLAWRKIYYGEWLPNTYFAKVGEFHFMRIWRGLAGLICTIENPVGSVLLAALAFHWLAGVRRGATLFAWLMLICAACTFMFLGLENFSWNDYYHLPFVLFGYLLLAVAFERALPEASGRVGRRPSRRATAAACGAGLLIVAGALAPIAPWGQPVSGGTRAAQIALGLLVLASVIVRHRALGGWGRAPALAALGLALGLSAASRLDWRINWPPRLVDQAGRPTMVDEYERMGRALRALSRPGDTLAAINCGAMAYASGLPTIDALGLNDPHIAHQPITEPRRRPFGHERGDGRYVLSRRPSFLVAVAHPTSSPAPLCPWDKSFTEMFRDPRFAAEYAYAPIPLEDGRYLQLYARREVAARPLLAPRVMPPRRCAPDPRAPALRTWPIP